MERMDSVTSTYCPRAGQYVSFCEDWGCPNIISKACSGYLDTNKSQSVKQIEHRQYNAGLPETQRAAEDIRMFRRRVA